MAGDGNGGDGGSDIGGSGDVGGGGGGDDALHLVLSQPTQSWHLTSLALERTSKQLIKQLHQPLYNNLQSEQGEFTFSMNILVIHKNRAGRAWDHFQT